MGAKTSTILEFRRPMRTTGFAGGQENRRPTDAERAFVRALARLAAQVEYERDEELARTSLSSTEAPCE